MAASSRSPGPRRFSRGFSLNAELARLLGIPRQRVNDWLSCERSPDGETTLLLLQWVSAVEAQQNKKADRASTQPARTTQKKQNRIARKGDPAPNSAIETRSKSPPPHTNTERHGVENYLCAGGRTDKTQMQPAKRGCCLLARGHRHRPEFFRRKWSGWRSYTARHYEW